MKLIIILLIFIIIFLNLILNEKLEYTEHLENIPTIEPEQLNKDQEKFVSRDEENNIVIDFTEQFGKNVSINDPHTVSFLMKLNDIEDYSSKIPIIIYSVKYRTSPEYNKGYIIFLLVNDENVSDKKKKIPSDLYFYFYDNEILYENIVSQKLFDFADKQFTNTNKNNLNNVARFIKEEDYNNIYYHFSVAQDNNYIDVFVDGLRASIKYPKIFLDQELSIDKGYIGNVTEQIESVLNEYIFKNKNTFLKQFNGDIQSIEIFKMKKTSDDLCNMWKSCGNYSCDYIEGGNDRDECYSECIKVDNCSKNECYNKCYNIKTSNWSKCDFIPLGNTLQECIQICNNKDNSCTYGDCQTACKNCKNNKVCYWVKQIKIKQTIKDLLKVSAPTSYSPKKPMYPRIIVRPQKKKGNVKILFYTPNILNSNGNFIEKNDNSGDFIKDPRITAFIYVLFKQPKDGENNTKNNIKIGIIKAHHRDSNVGDLNKDEFIYKEELTNLDPDSLYTIFIRSYRPNEFIIDNKEKKPHVNIDEIGLQSLVTNDDSDVTQSIKNKKEVNKLIYIDTDDDTSFEDKDKLSDVSNVVTFQPKKFKDPFLKSMPLKELSKIYNFVDLNAIDFQNT